MYKLFRFYNQNRKAIIIIVLIIVFFFIILRTANDYSSRQKGSIAQQTESYENVPDSVSSNKSALTGSTVYSKQLVENTEIIDKFLNYCKTNDISKAYDLVSNDCKDQLFKTIEDFKKRYVDIVLGGIDKVYTIENYYSNIYKVNFTENSLLTGKKSNYSSQEFIAIVKENSEDKLNINGLISVKEINKESEICDVKIKINKQYQYMDYTMVSISVTNNNSGSILLDNLEDINGIYIKDTNSSKYGLYSHEFLKEDLKVLKEETKQINLKFFSKYISSRKINEIVFNNIILNYDNEKYKREIQMNIDI